MLGPARWVGAHKPLLSAAVPELGTSCGYSVTSVPPEQGPDPGAQLCYGHLPAPGCRGRGQGPERPPAWVL